MHQPWPPLCLAGWCWGWDTEEPCLARGGDSPRGRAASMSPFPACCAGRQRCRAACARRHNSLPSGYSALPRPDKVPQPERGWAPVWVWSLLGFRVKAGASALSHGHCAAVPGRAGALGHRWMPMPCRAPALNGRGEGGLGTMGDTDPASPPQVLPTPSPPRLHASCLHAQCCPAPLHGREKMLLGSPRSRYHQCWH